MTAQELKNSILQLAVQGKLVPQNAGDEPASELLKRIAAERMRRIANGTLIVDKKHTAAPITEDDILYDLPDTWKWARFADIVTFNSGKTPQRQNTSYWSDGKYPWVSIADMRADGITTITKENISETAFNECFSAKISPAGTMIMSFKLTIGKTSILGMNAVHNEAIISIYPTATDADRMVLQKYLFKILPLIATTGNSKNAIKGKTLNATSLSNLMIPIPPLAEQERIVAKIEELLPFISEYDETEKRLTALNAEFPDKLRKSILQQAIQGELTERDPSDEPASELLKRIQTEKVKLIAERRIKKEKTSPVISVDDTPFDIPDTWVWTSTAETCTNIQYGTSEKSMPSGKMAVLRMGNLQGGKIDYSNLVYTSNDYDIERCHLEYNDLLFNRTNSKELVGKTAIYKAEIPAIYAGYLIRITPILIESDYLNYVMQSHFFKKYCLAVKTDAIGQSNINAEKLKRFVFPLPPVVEQKRIVARVEELFAMCDALK